VTLPCERAPLRHCGCSAAGTAATAVTSDVTTGDALVRLLHRPAIEPEPASAVRGRGLRLGLGLWSAFVTVTEADSEASCATQRRLPGLPTLPAHSRR
jgi:hypothetical protein